MLLFNKLTNMKKKCNLTLMFFLLLVGGKSYAQGSYALSVGDKITNQMTVTSVPNITMTFGGSDTYSADLWVDPISDPQVPGFTAVTNGNTQNPKDGAGKPLLHNLLNTECLDKSCN